jgi:hypothetical protein
MALSLEALHKPLNDFFMNLYGSSSVDVIFRFDKYGSVISDQDFTIPNHHELGLNANQAIEYFSTTVNHVAVDNGDNMSVHLKQDTLDDTYHDQMLAPALPQQPASADTFNSVRAHAQTIWTDVAPIASSSGLMIGFRPSLAAPVNWYDTAAADVWTHESLTVTEPASALTSPGLAPNTLQWRMQLNDVALGHVLLTSRQQLPNTFVTRMNVQPVKPTPRPADPPPLHGADFVAFRPGVLAMNTARTSVAGASAQPAPALASFGLHEQMTRDMATYTIADRLKISQVVAQAAPTQQAATNSISIEFDYSFVKVNRPWILSSFFNDRSWFVPGYRRGALSAEPVSFRLLPTAFVAIKALSIAADWSASDISSAANASAFGPFKIDAGVVNGKIGHSGLQIVAWVLQVLPLLPPEDDPNMA